MCIRDRSTWGFLIITQIVSALNTQPRQRKMSVNCHGCKEKIYDGERFIIIGQFNFHNEHFNCAKCGKNLESLGYNQLKDQSFICENCFSEMFLDTCGKCGLSLNDEAYFTFAGRKYHQDCFQCSNCKNPIQAEYKEVLGQPVCASCIAAGADKCHACSKAIMTSGMKAMAHKWHTDCFRCHHCNKLIETKKFASTIDGKPLHLECIEQAE
eukprot:TRINITY_DN1201_c0_g3_i6.p1 TRINITY_DN1201_c0_g3~~TRINITY_DN1201_c0_g3_i6.p1  ORF type:complete len:234 (+),score=68.19 TRINITY_DN1201_c0_g3_i6:70-702(+)